MSTSIFPGFFRTIRNAALSSLLLISVSYGASATEATAPQSCAISEKYKADLSIDAATDINALQKYKDTAAQMLTDKEYAQLDCLADTVRSKKELFPGGVWKIHTIYSGLTSPTPFGVHATGMDWSIRLRELRQWVEARPQSVTARVALASAMVGYAWQARGGGYADTVSDSGWQLFGKRLGEAKQILDDASALPTKCPESYLTLMNVAIAQGWNAEDRRALFNQAIATEPTYYYYYRVYATSLLPKWGGEEGEVERFLEEAANRLGGESGDLLYFQVATNLICGCNDDQGLKLSLPRIARGFTAAEKRFGISMLNLNLLASTATHSAEPDPIIAEKAFQRIGDEWDREAWKQEEYFRSAKEWAGSYSKVVAKRRALESDAESNAQSPKGAKYRAAFEEKFRALVKQCSQGGGAFPDKFETLIRVDSKGVPEEVRIYSNGPLPMCLYQTLVGVPREKRPSFAAPPEAPYSIKIEVDATAFSRTAQN